MKKNASKIFIAALVMFVFSCNSGNETDTVVTNRIQYDVFLQNPEQDMDWWVSNVEGGSREKLVRNMVQRAVAGEVKAYDFFTNKLYRPDEIKRIMKRIDTISVERSTPPYDLVDTIMVTEIRMSDINKLRFLEEWRMNEKTLAFSKKVVGICPMVKRLSDSGELRGYKPLFWVFFDEKYPAELELK